MNERICDICEGLVAHTITLRLYDDKERKDFTGHLKCINDIEERIKNIDYKKMSVKKIIIELNL